MSTSKEAFESADPEQDLRFAARHGDADKVEYLLNVKKVKVDANYGAALREAAEGGHLRVVKILLSHGANPFVLEAAPLRYAKKRAAESELRDDLEMVDVLEKKMQEKIPNWQPPTWPSPFKVENGLEPES